MAMLSIGLSRHRPSICPQSEDSDGCNNFNLDLSSPQPVRARNSIQSSPSAEARRGHSKSRLFRFLFFFDVVVEAEIFVTSLAHRKRSAVNAIKRRKTVLIS